MPALEYHNTKSSKLHGARQRHQNTVRFNPHRHNPENALPPNILRAATSLCCRRCQLILRWKIDYGKYPSLVQIRTAKVRACGCCGEKKVTLPLHRLCQGCSRELAVCAKCSKTPEESERLATAALLRAGRPGLRGDNDDGDADEEEEDEGDDSDDDEYLKTAAAGRDEEAEAKAAAKREEDRLRQEQDEADFPELAKLRGLDVSMLRTRLYEERKSVAVSALNQQGRMRERSRRTAMRLMDRGDEHGAAEVIAAAVGGRGGDDDEGAASDDDGEEEETDEEESDDEVEQKPVSAAAAAKPAAVAAGAAAAGDTSSDEETI